jgi:hypothetical protein
VNQQQSLQLFERLVQNEPQLKVWLQEQLDRQIDVLVLQNDEAQLRKAQGHAHCLRTLVGQLDDARTRLTR